MPEVDETTTLVAVVADSDAPVAPDQTTEAPVADENAVPDEWRSKVQKQNQENASLRTRLKEFEDQQEAARVAAMSEQDKLREERDSLLGEKTRMEQAIAERDLREKIVDAARLAGIVDPDAAYRLLDRDTLDADKISDAVKALADEKPYLVAVPPPNSGGSANHQTTSGRGGRDYSQMTSEQLSRLPEAEYRDALRSMTAQP